MLSSLLICALWSTPASTLEPDAGDMARALPFVTASVGEDVWAAFRGPEHRGWYRVVGSFYSRDANAIDLVVWWQVRNPAEDANRTYGPVSPQVREGTAPRTVAGKSEPAAPGALLPGQVSPVLRSRYTLPATTKPENLLWEVASDANAFVRIHLRPHLTTPKKALVPPPPPWQSQRTDAHSLAAPKFSVLRAGPGGHGCEWAMREAPGQPPRVLGAGTQGCNLTYVALRPDGKKALLDAMHPEEIDIAAGTRAPVTLPPAATGAKSYVGYTDRGDVAALSAKTNFVSNVIADPVTYTRYNLRAGKWKQADTLALHYPICDTFMAPHTPMARDMTCQYLHLAPGYTSPCLPLSMSHDTCNNPGWVPPSDALLSKLEPAPPKPGPRAWAHQKHWMVLETPWLGVAAIMQTSVATTPELEQPVMLVRGNDVTPLTDFAGPGPVSIAIRGPWLLVGRADIPRQGPHHFLGQQGPDRVFRLIDLRDGHMVEDFGPGFNSIAFWPAEP